MENEFLNETSDTMDNSERIDVRRIPIAQIDNFPEHPFKVKDDEKMEKLKDSISLYGVLTPVVARRCENGRYELISGHRRKYACKALGIEFTPAIVREMSREEAVIAMVDSNLQREHILPSEKAFAYHFVVRAQKLRRRLYLRFVRSSAYHGMNKAIQRIDSYVRSHAKIPLITLFHGMHFRIRL